ncbi:hypothetical protein GCM10010527_53020 [Streptomyces drozdowiczii]
MPGHHVGDRLPKGIQIQPSGQPDHERDVVAGVGAGQPVEEPQPPLRVRQRSVLGGRGDPEWCRRFGGGGEQRGEPGGGGSVEDGANADGDAGLLADAGRQCRRGQRMPAEREEVVVHADRGYAEHLGEQSAHLLLGPVVRRPATAHRAVRCGQRVAVYLAMRGDRQVWQHDDRVRPHVLRQNGGQPLAERVDVDRVSGRGYHVRYDLRRQPVAVVSAQHDDGLPYAVRRQQHGLDLAQLDPEAANLHLLVASADELQPAVVPPACQVAGAVHEPAVVRERVGDKASGGHAGTAEIAPGQPRTRHVQLADDTGLDRLQGRVEHHDAGVREGCADDNLVAERAGQRIAGGAAHRGLGGPVGIDHGAAGRPCGRKLRRAGLAGHDERGPLRDRVLWHSREDRGRHGEMGDALPCDEVAEGGRHQLLGYGRKHQAAAGQQCHDQFPERGVEGGRRELEHPRPIVDVQTALLGPGQRRHAAMTHHHALGTPGGPGSVDDVGRVRRLQSPGALGVRDVAAIGVGQLADGRGRVQQDHWGLPHVDHVGQRADGEHAVRRRVRQLVGDPLRRMSRIERQVGSTGLQHRQHRHHEIDGSGQRDGHNRLRPDAAGHEQPGEGVGLAVQLRVAHTPVADQERGRRPAARHDLPEEFWEGARRRRRGRRASPAENRAPTPRAHGGQRGDRPARPVESLGDL